VTGTRRLASEDVADIVGPLSQGIRLRVRSPIELRKTGTTGPISRLIGRFVSLGASISITRAAVAIVRLVVPVAHTRR